MSLPDILDRISPCVVALGHRIEISQSDQPPSFPLILGTGFVVDSRGLIVTNRHVSAALQTRPTEDIFVAFFRHVREPDGRVGVGVLFRNVTMWYGLGSFEPTGRYFGATPDMDFLTVDARDLDSLVINSDAFALRMGTEVVSVGFPSGRERLTPNGGPVPSQFHPFARRGIVSSVMPCPSAYPHGFSIDVLHEGGSSGSPICSTEDGRVLGLLYAGFNGEPITYGVPGNIIRLGLESVLEQWTPDETVATIGELTQKIGAGGEQPINWRQRRLSSLGVNP
jgi:hypothetical protein